MPAITLAEAKTHLNITAGTYDTELPGFISAAEQAIVDHIGPLSQASVTVRVDGGGCRGLVLPVGGVSSVTSVTAVGGTAVPMGDLYPDIKAGVIYYNDGSSFMSRAYDVAYVEGYVSLPSSLRMAVLEMVSYLWDSQRGGGAARIGSGTQQTTANTIPGADDDLPFEVSRLIAPYRRVGVR